MSNNWNKWIINKELFVHALALVAFDVWMIMISMIGALWCRYDFSFKLIDPEFLENVIRYIPFNVITTVVIFAACKLYTSLWRFASFVELKNAMIALGISSLLQVLGMQLMGLRTPRSYIFLYFVLLTVFTVGFRFSYRFLRIYKHNIMNARNDKKPVVTMIVGAGAAGFMIVKEMKNSKHLVRKIPCIIDDDISKRGTFLQGIPVVGGKEHIPQCVEKYGVEEIVIAIPTISVQAKKELLEICQKTNCKILILPGIYQLVREEVSVSQLRTVQIEDLLGREPVNLKMDEIMDYVEDKVILVTGGGGSIGSEICRQLAIHNPKLLIIFDIYENSAYELQIELKKKYPELNFLTLIGSVRDKVRINQIFETYHPELVFHAAAHKHVPLMEDSPYEAIKNNVYGTFVVARAADTYQAKKMVLISTDKAVRPTNVMGASKRLCELVIMSFAQNSKTEYAAVRFGNVLGSNGSVIPLFRRQIEAGGPVTVTHPDIIRYFMTIPEAVNLVLQCGARAKGGELFILDMGEPVKILDLAMNMIRLSGLVPGEDIAIQFTGLRPGEKLYEELLIDDKSLIKTTNYRIFVSENTTVDGERMKEEIHELIHKAFDQSGDIIEEIRKLVPEYHMPEQNLTGEKAAREAACEAARKLELSELTSGSGE